MKTEDLISALVADFPTRETPIERTMAIASAVGAGVALITFFVVLGFRADVASASETIRFQLKLVATGALLLPALLLVWRVARPIPERLGGGRLALLIAPLVVAVSCAFELSSSPNSEWFVKTLGSNSVKCLVNIPLLSIAPLCALLYGLSRGAPSKPILAGGLAGLASAAFAATLYATNCTDDSPLFVAVWYTTAVTFVTILGALLGSRLLRW